ncbi:outer membrane beta-barrel protein [Tabrizicola sp.]|uniref:outer membrane protein n=1 Tax=Tabrizicola sp. TaxID=2005166 RepID=UPI0025EB4241|nr:outer membrane beta-barrel protein [Tabrizicola sp.]
MPFAKLAASLALLSATTLPALAGGPLATATEAPVAAVAEAPADPWSGPWASFALGSGRATYDIAGSVYDPGFPGPLPGIDLPDFGGKGGTAGVELGYNHRVGDKLVFGVQLGRASSAIDTDAALNLSPILPLDLTYRYRAKSATSLLGRVGYLVNDKSMIFALAGVTRAQFDGTLSSSFGLEANYGLSLQGVTLGAGIETMVTDKISVRLDYRVTNFEDYNLFSGSIGLPVEVGLESNMQTVNAAVVMHF